MSNKNTTISYEEMTANQQAYNTDGDQPGRHIGGAEKIEIYSSDQDNKVPQNKDDKHRNFKTKDDEVIGSGQSKTLIRTDIDTHDGYNIPKLQNQEKGSNDVGYEGSSLNITSYNVYDKDGSKSEKPERVVVGVAGSSGNNAGLIGGDKNAPDWFQNYTLGLSRSTYNDMSEKEINQRLATGIDAPNIRYELEVREKVQELRKYHDSKIPITLAGDSKGGEDSAYLALKCEQAGTPIDHLYVTNPKGVRLNNKDYQVLEKMANEGRITVEIVYPEIVSDGLRRTIKTDGTGIADGRPIPCRPENKFYTVPVSILDTTQNHKIGDYEKNVYQGIDNGFKFQCNAEPEKITRSIPSGIMDGGSREELLGYRYKITKITNRSGQTISVNDYFFDEQVELVNAVKQRIVEMLGVLEELSREDVISYFSDGVGRIRNSLESKHEDLIENATPYETYKNDHKSDFEGKTEMEKIDLDLQLRNQYQRDIEQQVDEQSELYKTVVTGVVGGFVNTYKENVHVRKQELVREQERLNQVVIDINSAKVAHQKSQKEIEFVIEKRF